MEKSSSSNFLEMPSRSWHLKCSYFRTALGSEPMVSFFRHAWNILNSRSLANLILSMMEATSFEKKAGIKNILVVTHTKIKYYVQFDHELL